MNCQQYGQIFVNKKEVIGKGFTGSVYRGYFETECVPIAVKILSKIHEKFYSRQVSTLREICANRNVNGSEHLVRYHGVVETSDEYVLAIELCDYNLNELITTTDPSKAELKKIIYEVCQGLSIMHGGLQKLNPIIHRDIKPTNILLKLNPDGSSITKLADFGISKILHSSLNATTNAIGTYVWMSPSCLNAVDKSEKYKPSTKDDIFSLGILFYYVMTKGTHPFGNFSEQMHNIVQGNHKMTDHDQQDFALTNLVGAMIKRDPEKRPRIDQVISHPFFWMDDISLEFIMDLSNLLHSNTNDFRSSLDNRLKFICTCKNGWIDHLCLKVQTYLSENKKCGKKGVNKVYQYKSLISLIELIRDKYQHRSEWSVDLKELFEPNGSGYMRYFIEKFPSLILAVCTTEGIESLHLNPKFRLPSRDIFQIDTKPKGCVGN